MVSVDITDPNRGHRLSSETNTQGASATGPQLPDERTESDRGIYLTCLIAGWRHCSKSTIPTDSSDRHQVHCIGNGEDVTCACWGRELSLLPGKSNIKASAMRTATAAPNTRCDNGVIHGSWL